MNFDKIYSENHKMVLNYLTNRTSFELAQEITNDVFIKVNQHLETYDKSKSSISTWIMSFAKNKFIDEMRKNKLNTQSLSEMEDSDGDQYFLHAKYQESISTNTLNPERLVTSNEKVSEIHRAIDSLPKTYEKLTKMFYIDELSYDEISKKLDIPTGTVKGKLHRARKLLETKIIA